MEEGLAPVAARNVATSGNGAASQCVLGPKSAATTFVVASDRRENGMPVVSVTGDLDLVTAALLEDALLGLPDDTPGTAIVDLARCSFIDLGGLRVLLAASDRLERLNRPLALVVGNPSLLRVFKITRVDDRFAIYPSLAAAEEGNGRG